MLELEEFVDCNFVAKGKDDDEVMRKAAEHAKRDHHMQAIPPTTLRGLPVLGALLCSRDFSEYRRFREVFSAHRRPLGTRQVIAVNATWYWTY